VELRAVDNQFVHKGDVLYVIDPFDFEVSLRSNKAQLEQEGGGSRGQARSVRTAPASVDAGHDAGGAARSLRARQSRRSGLDAAQQQLHQAEINLRRTEVRSPVNGYVTNLLMRVGDFAHEGTTNISVIDSDSYWIDGYFEETKMARVCAATASRPN